MCLRYRQDAKRQTAGNEFTHGPKIRFIALQGRLIAPIDVKLGMADGHLGLLGCAKFHLNWCNGWECSPQNNRKIQFLVKSHLTGEPLDRFLKFLVAFTRLTSLD